MSAKKLTTTAHQIVVRSFRGARLVLCAVHPDRGFAWTTDRGNALKLLPADALKLARAAAIHWGADAVTLDIDGVAVQPKEARKARLQIVPLCDYPSGTQSCDADNADTAEAREANRLCAGEA